MYIVRILIFFTFTFFFFYCYADHRDLHSFPTRRSSDLECQLRRRARRHVEGCARLGEPSRAQPNERSEEHTSELQSRLHLVCRLLLEKKKKKNKFDEMLTTISARHRRHECSPSMYSARC